MFVKLSSPLVAFGLSAASNCGENTLSAAVESQKSVLSTEISNERFIPPGDISEFFSPFAVFMFVIKMYGVVALKLLTEAGTLNLSFWAAL